MQIVLFYIANEDWYHYTHVTTAWTQTYTHTHAHTMSNGCWLILCKHILIHTHTTERFSTYASHHGCSSHWIPVHGWRAWNSWADPDAGRPRGQTVRLVWRPQLLDEQRQPLTWAWELSVFPTLVLLRACYMCDWFGEYTCSHKFSISRVTMMLRSMSARWVVNCLSKRNSIIASVSASYELMHVLYVLF